MQEGDVKGKVDIQSPLDELDKFEPNENESEVSLILIVCHGMIRTGIYPLCNITL